MFEVVLQLDTASPTELVIYGSDVVITLLGLVISIIAYRGYRRHQSRPMRFIAAGFVLVFVVPTFLVIPFLVGSSTWTLALSSVAQASELCGMVSILYGLRMPTSR